MSRAAPAVAFVMALLSSVLIGGALHPPGHFPKYLQAATAAPEEAAARALDMSPLYLLMTRALAPRGPLALYGLNVLLLGVAAAGAAASVSRLAGPLWGLVAGLLVATYRPFLVYCGILEPEMAILAALSLAILCAVLARARLEQGASGSVFAAAAGAALGTAILLRPVHALLVPAWAVWIPVAAKRRWPLASLIVGAAVLVVLPVFVSRWIEVGAPVLMDPGPVFYEGNGPGATGVRRQAPAALVSLEGVHNDTVDYGHVAYRRLASFAVGRSLTPALSNAYWTSLTLEGIRASPAAALGRIAGKAVAAVMPYEAQDLVVAEDLDRRVRVHLPWGFAFPLVLLPSLLLLPRRAAGLLAGPLAAATAGFLVQTVFYASARERLPLAFGLLLAGIGAMPALPAGWRRTGALPAGLLLAASLSWVTAPFALEDQAQWDLVLGKRRGAGETLAGLLDGRLLRSRATREECGDFIAAVVAFRRSRDPRTLQPLRRLPAGSDYTVDDLTVGIPAYWLSLGRLVSGDREGARRLAREALRVRPGALPIEALAARLSGEATVAGEESWRPPGADPVSARWLLAEVTRLDGDPTGAARLLAPLAKAFPDLLPGLKSR